jgi:hypothetical protein
MTALNLPINGTQRVAPQIDNADISSQFEKGLRIALEPCLKLVINYPTITPTTKVHSAFAMRSLLKNFKLISPDSNITVR